MSLLTEQEIDEIQNREFSQNDWLWFYARAIEAKVIEKIKAHDIEVFRKGAEYAFKVTGGNEGMSVSDEEALIELKEIENATD